MFETRWVHVGETEQGAVYKPEDADIPLSRRPRERMELKADGSASLYIPGPDDRYIEVPATWTDDKGGVVVRAKEGSRSLRIVEESPSQLVVKVQTKR